MLSSGSNSTRQFYNASCHSRPVQAAISALVRQKLCLYLLIRHSKERPALRLRLVVTLGTLAYVSELAGNMCYRRMRCHGLAAYKPSTKERNRGPD